MRRKEREYLFLIVFIDSSLLVVMVVIIIIGLKKRPQLQSYDRFFDRIESNHLEIKYYIYLVYIERIN